MVKAFIDPEKCLKCIECEASKSCAINAIFSIDPDEPKIVEVKICRGCGDCIAGCKGKAIELVES